jgi:ATP-dependent RNA helicase DeaD
MTNETNLNSDTPETPVETTWQDLKLSPELQKIIDDIGYRKPSPVQAQTIPMALTGQDVLVSSQTGSGKTASFVIPTIERFKGKNGTYILALAPTREIAQQTGEVFQRFAEPFGMKVVVCIGGASMSEEKEALAASPHIIVATPGRLADHMERGNVWLDFIQCLIFDEADRMLEMGFAKQIDTITEQIPKERQTLMLSATFAPEVEKLARKSMNNPAQVIIKKTAETAPKIEQELYWIPEEKKLGRLMRLLEREKGTVFIFVNQKEKTFQLARLIINKGIPEVTYIHSDLQQEHREEAVADFKSGKCRIIVATDVMGRGIDVDDVAHVINYDVPKEPEDYIHRIGRTGRRGQTGHATTFAIPGRDDKAITAIAKLRGVQAPPKPEREERRDDRRDGSRDGRRDNPRGERGRGPRRDERRPDQPREARPPRDPSQPRPQRQRRPEGERRDHQRPPRQQQPQQHPAPQEVAPVPVQKQGFIKRILSKFGF